MGSKPSSFSLLGAQPGGAAALTGGREEREWLHKRHWGGWPGGQYRVLLPCHGNTGTAGSSSLANPQTSSPLQDFLFVRKAPALTLNLCRAEEAEGPPGCHGTCHFLSLPARCEELLFREEERKLCTQGQDPVFEPKPVSAARWMECSLQLAQLLTATA